MIIIVIHIEIFILLHLCSSTKSNYLDILLIEILLLSGDEVGAHDSALLSSGHLAGEHTAEGVESSLVRSGDHLTDVHHQRTIGVAGLDSGTGGIVRGSLVQQLGSEKEIVRGGIKKKSSLS